MAGVSTNDKSLFQSRRVVVPISEVKLPEKKKFRPAKLFPFKIFNGKRHLLKKTFFANKKRGVITVAVLGIVIGAGGYGYYQYLLSQNPAIIYTRKIQSMTKVVSNQVTLPKDEQPVIATISDVKQLPKERFFENAQNGDKILMYKKHKEAILYRPSTGKVITIATLDFKDVTPTKVPQTAVAGASTSAIAAPTAVLSSMTPTPTPSTENYVPQGKILIQPQN